MPRRARAAAGVLGASLAGIPRRAAVRQEARRITVDPTEAIERGSASAVGDGERFVHRPLTAAQVATFAAKVGERYAVYELLVLFMAYTGLRAAEAQGLEVRDLTLTTGPGGATRGSVRVQRIRHGAAANG